MESSRPIRFLLSSTGQEVLKKLANVVLTPKAVLRLRKELGEEQATAVVDQIAVSTTLRKKFGIETLLGARIAAEQASDPLTARYKAQRFPRNELIVDGCCGLGGDLREFVSRGPSLGIDWDAGLCLAAAANAPGSLTVCDAIERQPLPRSGWLHLDPDRRPRPNSPGERVSRIELTSPNADFLFQAIPQVRGGGVKVSPAAALPKDWRARVAREWISHGNVCRQQVLWFGELKSQQQVATVLHAEREPVHYSGIPLDRCSTTDHVSSFLYDFDPAIRAAGLTESFGEYMGMAAVGSPSGFWTSPECRSSGLMQSFQVLDVIPFDLRKLRDRLFSLDILVSEIKVRGVDRTPESILQKLIRTGSQRGALLISRNARRVYAALARRL